MKRLMLIVPMTLLLTACADGKFIKIDAPNTCGSKGWTLTAINYGDSHIVVIPVSEVVKDAELRFALMPVKLGTGHVDFKDATVKVRGKRPEDSWFVEKEGRATVGDGTIRVCLNEPSLDVGDEIHYIIEVDGVGILDPRAKVINHPSN